MNTLHSSSSSSSILWVQAVQVALAQVEECGFAVLEQALTEDECRALERQLDNWVAQRYPHPESRVLGLCTAEAHLEAQWAVRRHPRVQQVFAAAHECRVTDLITSMDGFYYVPAAPADWALRQDGPLQLDQSGALLSMPRQCLQAAVNLTPVRLGYNTMSMVRAEPSWHSNFFGFQHARHAVSPHHRYRFEPGELEHYWCGALEQEALMGGRGSMFLWDARTAYQYTGCHVQHGDTGLCPARKAIHVSMQPRRTAPAYVLHRRAQAYAMRRATGHWPAAIQSQDPVEHEHDPAPRSDVDDELARLLGATYLSSNQK